MFRVTGEDDVIVLETSHKPTAEESKRQYEASMGKKAKLIELKYTGDGYAVPDEKAKQPASAPTPTAPAAPEESESDR